MIILVNWIKVPLFDCLNIILPIETTISYMSDCFKVVVNNIIDYGQIFNLFYENIWSNLNIPSLCVLLIWIGDLSLTLKAVSKLNLKNWSKVIY